MQEKFDRYVKEGEQAIWIWPPIVTKRCPACDYSPSYHEKCDCAFGETPREDWSKGLVGFRPVPVFDISQTDGEPLLDLETAATGDGEDLVSVLLEAADDLDLDARIVDPDEWDHGDAKGICTSRNPISMRPLVEILDRSNDADLATTLIHEYAHARLHFDVDAPDERAKREVEAEAVAYVVGRYFGLDTSNSAFYLAAWRGEESAVIQERLDRISAVAEEIITVADR